ncbi:uncharacterized protein [Physcomitrium patens]|uniref:uncharacterized protein n=1 Tax=Physcomitrium patens TaxID=3218 RepID=UPI003CCD200E
MCVRKSGGGESVTRGVECPVEAELGQELVHGSGGGGGGGRSNEDVERLDVSGSCEGGDQEAKDGGGSVGDGCSMPAGEEKHAAGKEGSLLGVLEALMSLDSKGDFMGVLDGVSASNESRVAEAPMCFAMMQEKIRARRYSSWRMFVEDFEWICYNALRCNQKRSILWAAAGELLRRGKKRLEEYEGCGEKLVALDQSEAREGGSGRAKSEDVEGRIQVGEKCLAGEGVKMAISSASTGSAESEVPSCGGASMCKNAGVGKDSGSMRRGTAGTQMTEGEPSVDGKGAGAVSGGTWAHRDGATASTEGGGGAGGQRRGRGGGGGRCRFGGVPVGCRRRGDGVIELVWVSGKLVGRGRGRGRRRGEGAVGVRSRVGFAGRERSGGAGGRGGGSCGERKREEGAGRRVEAEQAGDRVEVPMVGAEDAGDPGEAGAVRESAAEGREREGVEVGGRGRGGVVREDGAGEDSGEPCDRASEASEEGGGGSRRGLGEASGVLAI